MARLPRTWIAPTPCPDCNPAPVLLYDLDCTALADGAMAGVTALADVPVTVGSSGSPSQWRKVAGLGIEVDDNGSTTGFGTIDIELTDLDALGLRPFGSGDSLVYEIQWAAASSAPTVNDTQVNIGFRPDSLNHNTQTGLFKDGVGNAIHYMFDGGNHFALHTTVIGARSASCWLMPGRGVLGGIVSSDALLTDAPRPAPTYALQTNASKTVTASGPWPISSLNKLRIEIGKGANETVPVYLERVRVWMIPGSEYVAP